MADLFVALPPTTDFNAVIFGKNSNRPAAEVQDVVSFAAADHAEGDKVQVTAFFSPLYDVVGRRIGPSINIVIELGNI